MSSGYTCCSSNDHISNSSTMSNSCCGGVTENSPLPLPPSLGVQDSASTAVAVVKPDQSASSTRMTNAKRWFRRSYGSKKMIRSASAQDPLKGSVLEQHASDATACETSEGQLDAGSRVSLGDSDNGEAHKASDIGPGHLGPSRSSLSVRTQHESLSLRTSFRSQLKLGFVPKSVQFDNLSIREYPIVIGDSPSTSRGVPISIGWEYGPECTVDLDAYEATRVLGGVCERRTKSELR